MVKNSALEIINERVNEILFELEQKNELLEEHKQILDEIGKLLPKDCELLNELEEVETAMDWERNHTLYICGIEDSNKIKELFN
ncbi:hypothetical protein [Clostridium haemolyticum]|uniref:Uncharacterized protein n=1 Tax=Clostridium haemolyticum NCTC 9693 TaxID=1443114 RepID=A0ABR4TGW0_CLOHA|nr:hypothetical protein [Clostridium haemolyticum]KEI18249.1 hypothetical protein Z960_03770 [Clostridium haemolyticum NCTC 9693]KGN04171.1 hypothetical protein Z961_04265 [Clostridium haemolyticum NCTC 8350]